MARKPKATPPDLSESQYTGRPDQGGEPCSDKHHAAMFLPEGAAYDMALSLCAACGKPEGFHHRKANCGSPMSPLTLHPLRVTWHAEEVR